MYLTLSSDYFHCGGNLIFNLTSLFAFLYGNIVLFLLILSEILKYFFKFSKFPDLQFTTSSERIESFLSGMKNSGTNSLMILSINKYPRILKLLILSIILHKINIARPRSHKEVNLFLPIKRLILFIISVFIFIL